MRALTERGLTSRLLVRTAPYVAAISSWSTGSTNSYTATVPNDVRAGDMIFFLVVVDGGFGSSTSPPSGYALNAGAGGANATAVWTKEANGSEGGGTVTWGVANTNRGARAVVVVRGGRQCVASIANSGTIAAITSAVFSTSGTPTVAPLNGGSGLALSFFGSDGEGAITYPANYPNNRTQVVVSGGGPSAAIASSPATTLLPTGTWTGPFSGLANVTFLIK